MFSIKNLDRIGFQGQNWHQLERYGTKKTFRTKLKFGPKFKNEYDTFADSNNITQKQVNAERTNINVFPKCNDTAQIEC